MIAYTMRIFTEDYEKLLELNEKSGAETAAKFMQLLLKSVDIGKLLNSNPTGNNPDYMSLFDYASKQIEKIKPEYLKYQAIADNYKKMMQEYELYVNKSISKNENEVTANINNNNLLPLFPFDMHKIDRDYKKLYYIISATEWMNINELLSIYNKTYKEQKNYKNIRNQINRLLAFKVIKYEKDKRIQGSPNRIKKLSPLELSKIFVPLRSNITT